MAMTLYAQFPSHLPLPVIAIHPDSVLIQTKHSFPLHFLTYLPKNSPNIQQSTQKSSSLDNEL